MNKFYSTSHESNQDETEIDFYCSSFSYSLEDYPTKNRLM